VLSLVVFYSDQRSRQKRRLDNIHAPTMVEGPGATRNGRKVQIAVGKFLVGALSEAGSGSVSEDATATIPRHLAGELANNILWEAFTVGKELFLIFASSPDATEGFVNDYGVALRLHFGMNGSLTTRKVKSNELHGRPSGVPPWKLSKEPTLRLQFAECRQSEAIENSNCTYVIVEAWETTVTYPACAIKSRQKLMDLTSRDVCSALFNAQDVFTSTRQLGNDILISDALLNQEIFPGVGNIIKIESLHRSMVDPRRILNSLTDPELRRIIRHARIYSMDWLKTGRAGTKLVYNQTTCGTCRGLTVKMQKIGGAGSSQSGSGTSCPGKGHAFMSRVTFWCTICQPMNSSSVGSVGSNLGTTSTIRPAIEDENVPNSATEKSSKPQMQCPQHGVKSLKLCRVRKENPNYLRIFMSCNSKGCQYFSWADRPFSDCRCGKKAILRVAKTERSGGRWFLCCATGDKSRKGNINDGCGHFEWATEGHLAPLRSLMTPLL
jgi:formamidopyrimidine-DNA glycosylase